MTDIRVSSFCPNANCVGVEITADGVAVTNTAMPEEFVAFTADEWSAFVAGVKAGEFDLPGSTATPEARLLALVAPFHEHDRAVRAAADFLRSLAVFGRSYDASDDLAHHMLSTWEAIASDVAEPEVLALPPEPEVGAEVEVLGGVLAGYRFTRRPPVDRREPSSWWHSADRPRALGYPRTWTQLLATVGPVHRVPPAEAGEALADALGVGGETE